MQAATTKPAAPPPGKRRVNTIAHIAITIAAKDEAIARLTASVNALVDREREARHEALRWKRQAENWRMIAQRGGR